MSAFLSPKAYAIFSKPHFLAPVSKDGSPDGSSFGPVIKDGSSFGPVSKDGSSFGPVSSDVSTDGSSFGPVIKDGSLLEFLQNLTCAYVKGEFETRTIFWWKHRNSNHLLVEASKLEPSVAMKLCYRFHLI